ncbi:MAG TPA: SAM-dependent methyltransferase, partial [Bacteroidota bacterium]|nr:SAM-dependent methyltransferase [Bacteroidota bacterium]
RILLQMGGRGNADAVKDVMKMIVAQTEWKQYFEHFHFAYGFYGPEEYHRWLSDIGFTSIRAELITKDGVHKSREAFAGWFRTTWIPWTNRVPDNLRSIFIDQVVDTYLQQHPTDASGAVHVQMMRLEVEAQKV